jgi:hypothetical protein
MMAWYVFALVDQPLSGRQGRGLAGALASRRVPGGFAIVERRGDVPPAEFGTLKAHHAVVARIADAVPAVLPVRFGTLLEMEEIEEALREREDEVAEAFAAVRGRVQFTWRRAARSARGGRDAAGAPGAQSGTDYLRGLAAAARPMPPAAFKAVRETLRGLVAAERFQTGTASVPDSLYHLVERSGERRYRLAADTLAAANAALRVTGPFPPFAFTPDLL